MSYYQLVSRFDQTEQREGCYVDWGSSGRARLTGHKQEEV